MDSTVMRLYQAAGIKRYNILVDAGVRRILLVLPTGGGKTVIAARIIRDAYSSGKRVIFFAHRRELIHQTRRKLIAAGVPAEAIGIMMADDPLRRDSAPIQVASIDTWRNREPPPADLVFIDEAHRSLSDTYLAAVEHYSSAVIIGMTATPYRADGGGLGRVYQELVVIAQPSQLIADGHLVEPRVFAAKNKPDLRGVRVRAGEYVESDLAAAMQRGRLVGDLVKHWQRHANGIRTVAFASSVAHSEAIASAFMDAGVSAEHLDGTTPTKERDAILSRLENGDTLVVSNCAVLIEGWDQPAVKRAILARPTMSPGLYLQMAGRILRPYEGQQAIILDHAGNALKHGLPQDDREFTLDETPKRDGDQRSSTKECPECGAIIGRAVPVCPECDYEFTRAEPVPPPALDYKGELVEIDLAERARLRAAWDGLCAAWRATNNARLARGLTPYKPGFVYHQFVERFGCKPPLGCTKPLEIATPAQMAAAYAELLRDAKARGYKPGWAAYRYHERFGEWPARDVHSVEARA